MSVTVLPSPAASVSPLRRLTLTEAKLFLRERTGPAFGIGFPLVLLIIFGNIPYFNHRMPIYGGLTLLEEYVPILVAFVIAMLAINIMPPVLAGYREKGILRRLRTTPVGPTRVLVAQLALTIAVTVVSITVLLLVADLAFGVFAPRQFAGFALAAILAIAALSAAGLFIAAAAPTGRAANAIGATMFYLMMFFAGLWIPVPAMPTVLRQISHATPLGAAVQALTEAVQGSWPHARPLLVMTAYAVVLAAAAVRLFHWE
jgi:ABC-2 type transport system permease protein